MAESREDRTKRISEEAEKLYTKAGEEQRSEAEGVRDDEEVASETDEEYYERIRTVPGIFGDIDTTGGANATGIDVPSSQNEQATVAAAKVDAAQEKGDDDADGISNDDARRSLDPTTAEAARVEESGNVSEPSGSNVGSGNVVQTPAKQEKSDNEKKEDAKSASQSSRKK